MSHRHFLTLWLIADIVVFCTLYSIAYFMRVGWIFSTDLRFGHFLATTVLAAPVWMCAMITTRTFALTRHQASWRNAAYVFFAGISGAAAFTLINYFGFQLLLSRKLLFFVIVLSTLGMWAWHIIFEAFLRRRLSKKPVFRVLVIGVTRESSALIKLLLDRKNPLKPVAILDGRGVKDREIHSVPVLGKLNKLEQVLEEQRITHLMQCADLEQSLNLLSACRNRGITYMLLPSVLGIVERDERIESLEGLPVTIVSPKNAEQSWFFR